MTAPTPPAARRPSARLFALLGFGAVLTALASGVAADPPGAKPGVPSGPPPFADWPQGRKPDAVLVLSGHTFGYLQPCGCSRPQTGGLERRAELIAGLKAKGWPVAGIDLGDLYPEKVAVRDQGRLKYLAAMNALRDMGYVAVGVGQTELAGGLDGLLGAYAAQKEQPPFTLAANAVGLGAVGADGKPAVIKRLDRFPVIPGFTRPLVGSVEIADVGGVPVGMAGVVGKALTEKHRKEKFDTSIDFLDAQTTLKGVVDELANHPKKPQFNVLIFQGGAADAEKVAKDFPAFNVILCQATDGLPPLGPKWVGDTGRVIVEVGHKGQHVGVVGLFRKPGGFELKYQLVKLGEEYIAPGTHEEATKKNPALKALKGYAEAVKGEIVLGKDYPRTPHPAQISAAGLQPKVALRYVGSDACKACHAAEYGKWKNAGHSHAMDTLEKVAARPNLRQYDGECVKCHSVGFNHDTGYQDEKATPHLKHVGCESCHGPGSGHVAQPQNKQFTELLSLWKQGVPPPAPGGAVRLPDDAFMAKMAELGPEERGKQALQPATQLLVNKVSGMCVTCHDQDADPHFDLYKYWAKIGHSGLAPPGGWPAVPPKGK